MDTDIELTALTEDERSFLKALGDAVANTLGGEQALLDRIAENANDTHVFVDYYRNDSDDPVGSGEYRASVALRLDWLSASGSECDAVELTFPEDEHFNHRYRAAESNLIARRWLYLEDGDLIFGNRKMWEWYLGRRIEIEATEPGDEQKITDPYRIFPRAADAQRAELKRSIEAVGLQNPLVVDERKNVIDGHDRRDVCFELGIDWMAGADVRIGLTDDQKKAMAIHLNMWRKPLHLTREKRNELIDIYLIAQPELSETQVAEMFGVDQSTINRRKKRLMQMHKLPPVQATVGKDGVRRKVGNRGARMTVKSEREYDSLVPDIAEVGDDLKGIIRRPKRFASTAKRKRRLAEVKDAQELPVETTLHNCDWRALEIEDGSVNVVLTDVLWTLQHRSDWCELAERARRWLKPSGVYATMIGSDSLPYLFAEVMKHLDPLATISVFLKQGKRNWTGTRMIERWRPVPVFALNPKELFGDDVIFSDGAEKDYHDYQQNVGVFTELLKRLSNPGDLIVDPCMGTGTTGLACLALGEGRKFVGCDRDQQMYEIARHRLAHDVASA